MTNFTVEATTSPVQNGDWSILREVLEAVPGSLLLEDADEPMLIIPVDADSPMKAATFVDGLSQVMDFEVLKGRIYEAEEADFDLGADEGAAAESAPSTPVARQIRDWFDEIPPVAKTNRSGVLVS